MKSRFTWGLLAILFGGLCLVASVVSITKDGSLDSGEEIVDVSFDNLLYMSDQFHEKRIRTVGYIFVGEDGPAVLVGFENGEVINLNREVFVWFEDDRRNEVIEASGKKVSVVGTITAGGNPKTHWILSIELERLELIQSPSEEIPSQ